MQAVQVAGANGAMPQGAQAFYIQNPAGGAPQLVYAMPQVQPQMIPVQILQVPTESSAQKHADSKSKGGAESGSASKGDASKPLDSPQSGFLQPEGSLTTDSSGVIHSFRYYVQQSGNHSSGGLTTSNVTTSHDADEIPFYFDTES